MSITLKPAPSRSSVPAHFRGIDGLRALAILGVIAFHTRPSLLQRIHWRDDVFRYHRFSCHTFGTEHGGPHRVLWIWPISDPPHYSFMAGDAGDHCVVPWLTWMFAPSLLQKVVSDSLPSALFASNWVYIFRKVPYFEAAGLPSPLTHLWFLGVTMQFYLVWPLLMVVLGKITKSKWVRSMAILVIMLLPPPTWCCCLTRPIPPACTYRYRYSPRRAGRRRAVGYLDCASSRGTEAAEAGAASQTVQIERQAGDKTAPVSLSSAMFLAPRLWRHC